MATLWGTPASWLSNLMVKAWPAGAARHLVSNAVFFAVTDRLVPAGEHVVCLACLAASFVNQVWNTDGDTVRTVKVMALWKSPHSSAHCPWYVPRRFGSMVTSKVLVRPGTTSRLNSQAGT